MAQRASLKEPLLAEPAAAAAPAKVLAVVVRCAVAAAAVYAALYGAALRAYRAAPRRPLQIVFGAALCFFGGIFAASVSAIEAWRHMGWARVREDVAVVLAEAALVRDASAADDAVDADADGVPDVEQAAPRELLQRKALLAMRTVSEPQRLSSAIGSLWAAYAAVLATLRFEFAQTTALALGVCELVRPPATRALAPPLGGALAPLELGHWVEPIVDVALKLVAVALAWYLRQVVSAFYSALRGGRLVADALLELVAARGWQKHVERLPGVASPFRADASRLDEAVAFGLAALGLGFQLASGLALPFPLNLALLPLTALEWALRWQITWAAPDRPL